MFNYVNEEDTVLFSFLFFYYRRMDIFSSVKFDVDHSIVLRGTHYLWTPL